MSSPADPVAANTATRAGEALVRCGTPYPDGSSTWEIVLGEGETASIIAVRMTEDAARAFRDGYNLARLHARIYASGAGQ